MAANQEGYLDWDESYILPDAYFNTGFLDSTPPMKWKQAIGLNLIPLWSGASQRQIPYVGDKAPLIRQAYEFNLSMLTNSLADLKAFEEAIAHPTSVLWIPGLYARDKFQAVSGQTYSLPRPRFSELGISGLDDATFPTFILLNGASNDGSAVTWIDEQTFTAATTGLISVRYPAAFNVAVTEWPSDIGDSLQMSNSVTLVEEIQADMG